MFRRGGQRDDRRRRVLTDDVVNRGHEEQASSVDHEKCEGASYAPEAALDQHLRLSDLIPRRLWGMALIALLGGSVIAGVLALYHTMLPQTDTGSMSPVFGLMASGSLASWTASVTLLLSSFASVIVLSMRRHKLSDYNGRYRIWAWTALAMLAMSAAATAPYHLVLAELLANVTGWKVPGGTATFWMAPAALGLGVLAVRLLLDVRDSKLATLSLVTSILAYGGAIGMELSNPTSLIEPKSIMMLAGCKLAGHLLFLMSVLLFARHVVRDIQGLVAAKAPRRKKAVEEEPKAKKKTSRRTTAKGDKIHSAHSSTPAPRGFSDLESETPAKKKKGKRREVVEEYDDEYRENGYEEESRPNRRNSKKSRQRQQDSFDDYDDYGDEPATNNRKLTKSQRKKLRKLKAQQRM